MMSRTIFAERRNIKDIRTILLDRIEEIGHMDFQDREEINKLLHLEFQLLLHPNSNIVDIEEKIYNFFKKTTVISKLRDIMNGERLWPNDVHESFIHFHIALYEGKTHEAIELLNNFRKLFGRRSRDKDKETAIMIGPEDIVALDRLDALIDELKVKQRSIILTINS